MKKLIMLLSVSALSLSVSAQNVQFVNIDNSVETEICIAAGTSKSALKSKVKELNFGPAKIESFRCNGLTVEKFGKTYSKQRFSSIKKVVEVYSFDNETGSVDADLCIAAAASNKAWSAALEGVKQRVKRGIKKLECNGMPVAKFAKKYGNDSFKF